MFSTFIAAIGQCKLRVKGSLIWSLTGRDGDNTGDRRQALADWVTSTTASEEGRTGVGCWAARVDAIK